VPGVVAASTTLNFFIPGFAIQTLVQVEGQPTPTGQGYTVLFHRISPGYFETMRIPVLEGRAIDDHDIATTTPVAVVSRQFAAKFWPGASAVGRRVQRGGATSPWITIVGVAGDVSDAGFSQAPIETLYIPFAQNNNTNGPSASSSARPAIRPAWSGRFARRCGRSIRAAARRRDGPRQVPGRLTRAAAFRTTLLVIFGGIGLVIALVGVYGVAARSVADRTREVGVRLALGGRPRMVWMAVASARSGRSRSAPSSGRERRCWPSARSPVPAGCHVRTAGGDRRGDFRASRDERPPRARAVLAGHAGGSADGPPRLTRRKESP
jgi:hypothetical protein